MKFSLSLFAVSLLATSSAAIALEKRAENCVISRSASCNWGPGPVGEYPAKHNFNGGENIRLECNLLREGGPPSDNKYWLWVPKWGCYVNRSHFQDSCASKVTQECTWGLH